MPHSAQPASRPVQDLAYEAHEGLDPAGLTGRSGSLRLGGLRPVVRDSWQRSLRHATDPDRAVARLVLAEDELDAFRREHPLAAIMPVFSRLLVEPSQEAGMLVAVGDQHGRLLWVDGDTRLRERAEGMMFMPGADWSEASVGTSAPGTALALGHGVQIAGAEHFSRAVHSWSCTAVPIHDPDSGAVLGVVDLTGREEAAAPHTLSLVRAAVAAAEAELRIIRLQAAPPSGRARQQPATLTITGRDHGAAGAGRPADRTVPAAHRDPHPDGPAPGRPDGRATGRPAQPARPRRNTAGRDGPAAQTAGRHQPGRGPRIAAVPAAAGTGRRRAAGPADAWPAARTARPSIFTRARSFRGPRHRASSISATTSAPRCASRCSAAPRRKR